MKFFIRISFFIFLVIPQVSSLKGQNGEISGTVIDASTGEPLIGHSAILFGTTYGQATDENGYFELSGLKTEECEIMIDGGQSYLTLSIRSIPLSKRQKVIDLGTIYLTSRETGYNGEKAFCIQLADKFFPYEIVSGAERYIQGDMGIVNLAVPFDSCNPQQWLKNSGDSGKSAFNRFPGGSEGLREHIGKTVRYPETATQHAETGLSFSSITITPKGTIEGIRIHNSLGQALDSEIVRALETTDGQWMPDNSCMENQIIYIQVVFQIDVNGSNYPIILNGENILQEVVANAISMTGENKSKSASSLYKRAKRNLNKQDFDAAISDIEICIRRDPFNLQYRSFLALCYEGTGNTVLKAKIEAQIQDLEDHNYISALGSSGVFGNIKIYNKLENGTFSVTELLRDSTLLYTGKLKSIYPEKKHGKFYFYNDLGKISAIGQYEDDIPVGVWTYFNKEQEAIFATNYTQVLNFILAEDTADINRDPLFICEIMPKFNGGDPAVEFDKYILENIIFPEYPRLKGIYGRVIVQFMVDYTGKVRNPQIVRGVHTDLNVEALRVISDSPTWTPGVQRNSPTDVLFTFPINFSMGKPLEQNSNHGDFEKIESDNVQGGTFDIMCDGGYAALDSPPLFEGQDPGKFRYYIANTLQYPEKAAENGIRGRVVVQFAIGPDGSVGEVTLVQSADPELNKEAIRVIKSSPDWIPAKKDGQNVICYLRYPFNFVL